MPCREGFHAGGGGEFHVSRQCPEHHKADTGILGNLRFGAGLDGGPHQGPLGPTDDASSPVLPFFVPPHVVSFVYCTVCQSMDTLRWQGIILVAAVRCRRLQAKS